MNSGIALTFGHNLENQSLTKRKQSSLKQHWNWSQYSFAVPKQSKLPSTLWILRINSSLVNPKVFFIPRDFAFALISCIFIPSPQFFKNDIIPIINIVFRFWLIVKNILNSIPLTLILSPRGRGESEEAF